MADLNNDKLSEKYTTVKNEAHVEFEEKRSLFIGHALHVNSEEEEREMRRRQTEILNGMGISR